MSRISDFQRAVYFGIVRVLRESAPIIESNPTECVPFNVNKFGVTMGILKENGETSGNKDTTITLNDNDGNIIVEGLKTFNAAEIESFSAEMKNRYVEGCEPFVKVTIITNDFTIWLHVSKS